MVSEDDLLYRYFKAVAHELGYETHGELVTVEDGVGGYKYPFLVVERDLNGLWSLWIVGAFKHPRCDTIRCTSYSEFGGNSTGMSRHDFRFYLRGIMAAAREQNYNNARSVKLNGGSHSDKIGVYDNGINR